MVIIIIAIVQVLLAPPSFLLVQGATTTSEDEITPTPTPTPTPVSARVVMSNHDAAAVAADDSSTNSAIGDNTISQQKEHVEKNVTKNTTREHPHDDRHHIHNNKITNSPLRLRPPYKHRQHQHQHHPNAIQITASVSLTKKNTQDKNKSSGIDNVEEEQDAEIMLYKKWKSIQHDYYYSNHHSHRFDYEHNENDRNGNNEYYYYPRDYHHHRYTTTPFERQLLSTIDNSYKRKDPSEVGTAAKWPLSTMISNKIKSIFYSIVIPISVIFTITSISSILATTSTTTCISSWYHSIRNTLVIFQCCSINDWWRAIPVLLGNAIRLYSNNWNNTNKKGNKLAKYDDDTTIANNINSSSSSSSSCSSSSILSHLHNSLMNMNLFYFMPVQYLNTIMIEPIQTFMIQHDIIQRSKHLLFKFIYVEVWRRIWNYTFSFLRINVFTFLCRSICGNGDGVITVAPMKMTSLSSSWLSPFSSFPTSSKASPIIKAAESVIPSSSSFLYKHSFWEQNAPEFLKRGLKKMFVKYTQEYLESFIGFYAMNGYNQFVKYYYYNDDDDNYDDNNHDNDNSDMEEELS
jgi:hypothetical protein